MPGEDAGPITIELLADHKRLIVPLGELCWREWGHPPEPTDREWWIAANAREAGRERLPISWVAIDAIGNALGRVGLGEFDPEERRDRSPWIQGMIVQPEHRGVGIGGRLMAELERWARERGYDQAWVATGGRAIDFYRKCGWTVSETFVRDSGEVTTVLTKRL